MGLTFRETGRLTVRKFYHLYDAYKQNFDLELSLLLSRKLYRQIDEESIDSEDWIK
jgi:hypothetical protein